MSHNCYRGGFNVALKWLVGVFHIHHWRFVPVTSEGAARGVTARRKCWRCGIEQIRKPWYRGWQTCAVNLYANGNLHRPKMAGDNVEASE
jgi:hypothetical protein